MNVVHTGQERSEQATLLDIPGGLDHPTAGTLLVRGRNLRTRVHNGRKAQVISGVKPGDTVLLYPGENLSDGVRLQKRTEDATDRSTTL